MSTPAGAAGDILARMAQKLAAAGIPYMVVDSFAIHGVPRITQDLDIVIDQNELALRTRVQSLL